jgi:hypothetical protein
MENFIENRTIEVERRPESSEGSPPPVLGKREVSQKSIALPTLE